MAMATSEKNMNRSFEESLARLDEIIALLGKAESAHFWLRTPWHM